MRLTEEEVQRLRENGFSDQDINEYAAGLEQQAQPNQAMAPVQPTELPMVSEVDIPTTQQPPAASGYESVATGIATMAPSAELIKDIAIPTAGVYGAYKGLDAYKQASLAKQAQAAAEMAAEQGRAARAEMRAGRAPMPTPTQAPPTSGFPRGPVPGPVQPPVVRESVGMRNMPGQAATGTAATGVMARGAEYAAKIRELAASKALQGTSARAGVGGVLMSIPGNVGQNYNVPQTGPLRGSEINPQTGRGWTPEELARYNAQFR
jgi:hypothetical protein